MPTGFFSVLRFLRCAVALPICPALSAVATSALAPAANFGPYVLFLEGGIGLSRSWTS
jgi:hypothetical protein